MRVLDPPEYLTYLASFGNSIMAEVSRLRALRNSQMKNSFLSSISHELRSPLHGVLASVEFLQDSELDEQQQDMVSTINSCGRTLLDTINHVLDFTRLEKYPNEADRESAKLGRKSRKDSHKGIQIAEFGSQQQSKTVDVAIITEEVLDGVYAGHDRHGDTSTEIYAQKSSTQDIASSIQETKPQPPLVIADIGWRMDWRLAVNPGAWRRLVMNLFGNALKYTTAGFIRVSLSSCHDIDLDSNISSPMLLLTVSDSGKGISKEFLRHHIYTPFAQEDSLAVGTGLGLSIVRRIVDEFGGLISITSEQEIGTEVKVSIPLSPPTSPSSLLPDIERDTMTWVRHRTHGLNICLVGFDLIPNVVDEPTGILSVEAEGIFSIRDSLTSLMKHWFSMEVTTAPTLDLTSAAVYCVMESTFNELIAAGWTNTTGKEAQAIKPIMLVLCTKVPRPYACDTDKAVNIVYLQQP